MSRSHILRASLIAATVVAGLTACDNDKLTKVNVNPNAPETVSSASLFTNATVGSMSALRGNVFEHGTSGVWVQHYSEIQYPEDDLNEPRPSTIELYWTIFYAGTVTGATTGSLQDYNQILLQSADRPNIVGPTLVMRSFLTQSMTDMWGDMPFSEAGKALPQLGGNLTPKYDTQAAIYDSIFVMLKQAASIMVPSTDQNSLLFTRLGSADPVYGHNGEDATTEAAQWVKLANTLRARAAMRISDVEPAKAKAELLDALANPVFTSNADNAFMNWPGGTVANPLCLNWIDMNCGGTRDDQRLTDRLIDTLKVNADPRLAKYAEPTGSSTGTDTGCDLTYRGYPNGHAQPDVINPCDPDQNPFGLSDFSRPTRSIREASSPSYIMTYSELLFIKAEAAAKGWIAGSAAQFYNDAITASMEQWGVSSTDISAYLARPSVQFKGGAQGIQQIAYEKWISLFNLESEAWAEWRRLDYPILVPGPDASTATVPTRLPYPDIESSLNATNLAAAQAAQGGVANTTIEGRVWWDTKAQP